MTLAQIRDGWNRFFHEPVPGTVLGFYRVLYGMLLLAFCALIGPDLLTWYGPRGVLPLKESISVPAGGGFNLLFYLPNTNEAVIAFFALFVLASFCVTIGLFTRVACIIAFIALATLHHRNTIILNSGDSFLRLVAFWMCFAPAGAAFSVDRLIRIARGKEADKPRLIAPWALRMIQLQLCFVYLSTVLWKFRGTPWMDGTAIYYTSRLDEFVRYSVPYAFEHLWTIKAMTWGTLAIEFALGAMLWIKDLRYWILLSGVLLHLGIEWTMNIPLFAPIMLAAYITWVHHADLARAFVWARSWFNRLTRFNNPLPVFYDGKCSFCIRCVAIVRQLDSLRRLHFVDMHDPATRAEFPDMDIDRATSEMLVRQSGPRWFGGFDAFRVMARQLPLGWLLLPLLYLPPVPQIGRIIYRSIAARRHCLIPKRASTPAGSPLPAPQV